MPEDPTEYARRNLALAINQAAPPEDLPQPQWTSATLREEFEVHAFLAPFVIVTRKASGEKGTLLFQHHPRVYFSWTPDPQA